MSEQIKPSWKKTARIGLYWAFPWIPAPLFFGCSGSETTAVNKLMNDTQHKDNVEYVAKHFFVDGQNDLNQRLQFSAPDGTVYFVGEEYPYQFKSGEHALVFDIWPVDGEHYRVYDGTWSDKYLTGEFVDSGRVEPGIGSGTIDDKLVQSGINGNLVSQDSVSDSIRHEKIDVLLKKAYENTAGYLQQNTLNFN